MADLNDTQKTSRSTQSQKRATTPDLKDGQGRPIRMDSPRLVRAMRVEGVESETLRLRNLKSFRKDGKQKIMPEIAERRLKAYDAIRLENTTLVLETRAREIEKEALKQQFNAADRFGANLGKEGLGIGKAEAMRLMEEAQRQAEKILVIASKKIEAEKEKRKKFEGHVQEVYRSAIKDQLAAEEKEAKIAKDMEKTRFEMELQRQEREKRQAAEDARLVAAAREFEEKRD
eukprot:SAG22_NODE_4207_length_1345_cov_4.157202_1_plen_230_part_10